MISNVKKDLYALVIDNEPQVSDFIAQILRVGSRKVPSKGSFCIIIEPTNLIFKLPDVLIKRITKTSKKPKGIL
jgi:hypothetical protein